MVDAAQLRIEVELMMICAVLRRDLAELAALVEIAAPERD